MKNSFLNYAVISYLYYVVMNGQMRMTEKGMKTIHYGYLPFEYSGKNLKIDYNFEKDKSSTGIDIEPLSALYHYQNIGY